MALTLIELDAYPGRIAATDVDGFVEAGVFFLDFSRPLEHKRRLGAILEALFTPIIHEGQREGGYLVGVHRSEPCFECIRALRKRHYPASVPAPAIEADGLQVIADLARQFPPNCE